MSAKSSSPRDAARTLFRNAILDAAERVFGAKGFHASRIQDIAADAGVGVGTVYNHFEQKEDVLRALFEDRTEEMVASLSPVEGEPQEFEARLKARMTRLLEFVDRHRGYFRLFMAIGMTADVADESMRKAAGTSMKRAEAVKKTLAALVREGIDAGALSAPSDPANLVAFLGGTIRSIIFRNLAVDAPSLVPCAQEITELFLYGSSSRGRHGGRTGEARR